MDTPGYDPVSVTGQVAGGCTVVVFTTGRGSCFGFKPSPSIKIASNSELYRVQQPDMDVNAGRVLDGATLNEVGAEIFEEVLAVASGKRTKSSPASAKRSSIPGRRASFSGATRKRRISVESARIGPGYPLREPRTRSHCPDHGEWARSRACARAPLKGSRAATTWMLRSLGRQGAGQGLVMTNEEQRQVLKRRAYERCLRNLALRLEKAGLAEAELATEIRTSGGVHPPTRRSRGALDT